MISPAPPSGLFAARRVPQSACRGTGDEEGPEVSNGVIGAQRPENREHPPHAGRRPVGPRAENRSLAKYAVSIKGLYRRTTRCPRKVSPLAASTACHPSRVPIRLGSA
jgi:hypothetical protein